LKTAAHPNKFPSLLSDIQIGNMKLKNRIGLAPMTRISASEDGQPTEIMLNYYESFAQGGFGLLITEGAYPDCGVFKPFSQTLFIDLSENPDDSPVEIPLGYRLGRHHLVELLHGFQSEYRRQSSRIRPVFFPTSSGGSHPRAR
jgi:hypothetical protein